MLIIPPQRVLLMMTRVISANLVRWEVPSVIFSFPGNVCGDLALGGSVALSGAGAEYFASRFSKRRDDKSRLDA